MAKTYQQIARPPQRQKNQESLRLQKLIAEATSLSRRAAEEAILAGKVKVNGVVVTKLGTKVDPGEDRVIFEGKLLRQQTHKYYFAYYKPKNTIVSKSDPEDRPTIWDGLPKEMKDTLNSAGRLDFESEGLLLLTNDGDLINKLTHPSGKIKKTYQVKVQGLPKNAQLEKFEKGIMLEDGMTLPAEVKFMKQSGNNSWIEVSIFEGKNRQIRRMFDAIGHRVSKLRRISIGGLKLGNLAPGRWRSLTAHDISRIKHS